MSKLPPVSHPIIVTYNGKDYSGSYQMNGDIITVNYAGYSKTTQLGGSAGYPESLAKIMMAEIIKEKNLI